MAISVVVAIAACVVLWSVLSQRAERWNVSAPMFFVAAGALIANGPTGVIDVRLGSEGVRTMAELTLAIVLFSDAASVRVRELRHDAGVPTRLLVVGLPLTIAFGTLLARVALPGASWWLCALVGAAVAPTDAALGAAIIEDERIPVRIRRALNVESGLNDGIATPFVKFFLVAAVAGSALEQGSRGGAAVELLVGAAGGAVIGGVGALLLRAATVRRWGRGIDAGFGVLALALLAYAAVLELGGNGFVAAFVAGLAFGALLRGATNRSDATAPDPTHDALDYTHRSAALMSMVVWFLFGAVMVPAIRGASWRELAFGVLALTVVRMVPVGLALVGSGFDAATVALIGWFGPRGLASVVFALLAEGALGEHDARRVVAAIAATVLLSVVAHGASAAPLSRRYAASLQGSVDP